jgi:hypothetical protein
MYLLHPTSAHVILFASEQNALMSLANIILYGKRTHCNPAVGNAPPLSFCTVNVRFAPVPAIMDVPPVILYVYRINCICVIYNVKASASGRIAFALVIMSFVPI